MYYAIEFYLHGKQYMKYMQRNKLLTKSLRVTVLSIEITMEELMRIIAQIK